MKKIILISYLFLSQLIPDVSKAYTGLGVISRENAQAEMAEYAQVSRKYLKLSAHIENGQPELVGHRAGCAEEYAAGSDGKFAFKNVVELMDRSFHELGLSGVEIDINLLPSKLGPVVYVAHDAVNPRNARALSYVRRNELTKILNHYVKNEYYKEGKKIFIEIKTPEKMYWQTHPELEAKDVVLIRQALRDIDQVLKYHPDQEHIRPLIGFVAFNYYALETVSRLSAHHYPTYWIATANRGMETTLLQVMGMGGLNSFMEKKLKRSPWLTGIWFDPLWIEDYPEVFNEINEHRHQDLEFYLSTIGVPFSLFRANLWKNQVFQKLQNFKGLIFDISKD